MGWIEIPQIKFHLSEIDTKGVLIILNEVFQQKFLIPPVYWKVPRANENEPWKSRPVSRECVNVQGTKQGYRAAYGEGRMWIYKPGCALSLLGARAEQRLEGWASSLKTDLIPLLTWFGAEIFQIRFCLLLMRWPFLLMRHFWGWMPEYVRNECSAQQNSRSPVPKFKGD